MDRGERAPVTANRPSPGAAKRRPMDYYAKYVWMAISVCLAISTLVFARMYFTKSAEYDMLKNDALEAMGLFEAEGVPADTTPFGLESYETGGEYEVALQCSQNLASIEEACWRYAEDNNGRYPTSWSSLVPKYLPAEPRCPQNNSRYNVRFYWDRPPEISCPNHGYTHN